MPNAYKWDPTYIKTKRSIEIPAIILVVDNCICSSFSAFEIEPPQPQPQPKLRKQIQDARGVAGTKRKEGAQYDGEDYGGRSRAELRGQVG